MTYLSREDPFYDVGFFSPLVVLVENRFFLGILSM